MSGAVLLATAMAVDAVLGEPEALWRRARHPVAVMGAGISWLETRWNQGALRRHKGVAAMAVVVAVSALVGWAIAAIPDGGILEVLGAAVLIAQRSLVGHVLAVARGLEASVAQGRAAVALIVGRETGQMDEPAVARAAIESAAENLSDGVVAPAFWFLVAGLPGILVYKAVNTADSTIGHRSARYLQFGWAAARLDDLLNWLPARLTGMVLCLVGRRRGAWDLMVREAGMHRSPNAGWPEAAMAASLGVALSGPRIYEGRLSAEPFINAGGARAIGASDIRRAVSLLWRTWAVIFAGLLAVVLVV